MRNVGKAMDQRSQMIPTEYETNYFNFAIIAAKSGKCTVKI